MTLDLLDHTGLIRNLSLSIVYLHPEVDNANRCWGLWDEASCPPCPEFWNNMPKLMLRCPLAVFNLLLSLHLCACNSWHWKYFHCHCHHLCERQFLWKITSFRILLSQEDFNVLKNKQDRRCYSKYRRSKSYFLNNKLSLLQRQHFDGYCEHAQAFTKTKSGFQMEKKSVTPITAKLCMRCSDFENCQCHQ